MARVGPALVASAATLVVGLGMLGFSSFTTIKCSAPTIAMSLAVSLAASLTVTPAMMAWFGPALFWPFRAPHHHGGPNEETTIRVTRRSFRFWDKAAELIVTYPLSISVLCLVALAPLAVAGARTTSSYGKLADLDPKVAKRRSVSKLLQRHATSPRSELESGRGPGRELPQWDFRSRGGKEPRSRRSLRRLAGD